MHRIVIGLIIKLSLLGQAITASPALGHISPSQLFYDTTCNLSILHRKLPCRVQLLDRHTSAGYGSPKSLRLVKPSLDWTYGHPNG